MFCVALCLRIVYFAMTSALYADVLVDIILLPLLCALVFGLNAFNKCVTYLSFVVECETILSFWTHQLPPYSFLHLWDEVVIRRFVALCSMCKAFIASRSFVYLVTHVQSRFSLRVIFFFLVFLHTISYFISCFSLSFIFHNCFAISLVWRFLLPH